MLSKRSGQAGLLGLTLSPDHGGSGLGPRAFAGVVTALAEADASVALVYNMHICGIATIQVARPQAATENVLKEIGAGRHLTTLAFSEAGSRSHFWAPVSRARRNDAGMLITAKKSWVTSAGHANSYVVSSLSPEGAGPTRLDTLSRCFELEGCLGCGPVGRLRDARQRLSADCSRGLRGGACRPADQNIGDTID